MGGLEQGAMFIILICLTTLSRPLTLMAAPDPLATYHGLTFACHEGGG